MAKVLEQSDGCIVLARPAEFGDVQIGSSISVDGVCLTVVALHEKTIAFDVMPETKRKTTIDDLAVGDSVNLERALPAHGRFEGHVVQGHAEGVGEIVAVTSSIPRPLPPVLPYPSIPSPEGGREERDWKHKQPVNEKVLWHARDMRKQPTEAEAILWEHLRFDQLGVRFRRQHPLDGSILDFYCHDAHLAIELDGPIHDAGERHEFDENRMDNLSAKYNIHFLRLKNDEVLRHLPEALSKIRNAIQNPPPPSGEGQGVGENLKMGRGGGDVRLTVRVSQELARTIVPKGSIAIDGVSLTVADVSGEEITVALIPMTLTATTLGRKKIGDRVNIETDILVRTLLAMR